MVNRFFFYIVFVLIFFFFYFKRPQEGYRRYRRIFSVMHSRILWWMESQQDVFHPSPGVSRFPLVRQEDAPFFEILFVRPAQRGWYQEFEFSDSDSDDFLDLEDFDIV